MSFSPVVAWEFPTDTTSEDKEQDDDSFLQEEGIQEGENSRGEIQEEILLRMTQTLKVEAISILKETPIIQTKKSPATVKVAQNMAIPLLQIFSYTPFLMAMKIVK